MRKALGISVMLFLVGCKSNPPIHVQNPPVKALPSGWTQASSKDGLVSAGVPGGWRFGVDRMTSDFGSGTLGDDASQNPQLQQLTQQMDNMGKEAEQERLNELYEKGILLHVINGSKPIFDEARTKFVVRRQKGSSNWTFDQAAELERGEYAHKPNRKDVNLPIGRAVKLWLSEDLRNGSTIHRISYLAIEGKDLYVLRFVTQEPKETIESVADQVAQTWRIKPG